LKRTTINGLFVEVQWSQKWLLPCRVDSDKIDSPRVGVDRKATISGLLCCSSIARLTTDSILNCATIQTGEMMTALPCNCSSIISNWQ